MPAAFPLFFRDSSDLGLRIVSFGWKIRTRGPFTDRGDFPRVLRSHRVNHNDRIRVASNLTYQVDRGWVDKIERPSAKPRRAWTLGNKEAIATQVTTPVDKIGPNC